MKKILSIVKNSRLFYLFVILAGSILPLAFSPFDISIIAIISPAILFMVWLNVTAKKAFWLGYCFGVAYFVFGVSWVSVSMYRFGGVPMPLAAALTVLFALFLATYVGAAGYLIRRFFGPLSHRWQLLVVMPGMWLLVEWLRSWLFTGFPWLNLGYSQTSGPLQGFAPVVGVYGISYLLLILSGLLCLFFIEKQKTRWFYLVSILAVGIVGLLFNTVNWVAPKGELITASLLQGNVPQDKKWQAEYRQSTIDEYLQMTYSSWKSDIIIWPETALPAYYHQAKTLLRSLANQAKLNNSSVLVGLPVLDEMDSRRYYNSMVLLGDEFQFYHKHHLVPFGEFVPLKWLLGDLITFMNIPMANFSRGDKHQPLLVANGIPLGISICYEDVFGEEVIEGLPEAQVLVNVSNDAWFGDSFAPHQHMQMARMRAMETGRPMLRATNNGVSAIIDHEGNVLKVAKQFSKEVLTGQIQPMQGTTPYVIWGNKFILLVCVFFLGIGFWRNRKLPVNL